MLILACKSRPAPPDHLTKQHKKTEKHAELAELL